MGYPSTWKEVLDENGKLVPKKDRNGEIIHNKDGSVRYKKEPDGQGVIDWIEEQKKWIQKEMLRRYDRDREYKGSHIRGNLSIPDYRVARAKERQAKIEKQLETVLEKAEDHIMDLVSRLDGTIDGVWEEEPGNIIAKYLQQCPGEYDRILKQAKEYLDRLPMSEHKRARTALTALIKEAQLRTDSDSHHVGKTNIVR